MTTIPQPRQGRLRRPPLAVIVAGALLLALAATFGVRALNNSQADPLADATLVPVTRGDLTLGVSATGQVEPRVQAELAFPAASGRVAEVRVAEGDAVRAGDVLITLDSRQLAAAVDAAAANLAVAQADLQALRDGATPAQIAEAQAQVQAAASNLTQIQGSVTQADIVAARAAVDEARARLAELESGPASDERTRAVAALEEARAELDRQRSALASAKEQARLNVETAANAVRNAQSAYSTAYWDLEHVKRYGTDPRTLRALNDSQTQDFVVAFEQASRALADAEAALAQAQTTYATAQQDERSGLATAEARVRTAQADLDALLAGADADDLASARAQLARAEAELARLTGAERAGAVAAQAANLEAAQARLDQITADPTTSDLARAEARVAQAEAQLAEARIRLDDATLRAPFDGIVATVSVAPGESIATAAPVVLIDVSRYLVKVTVDEVDIARVRVGQPVNVLIDALGETLPGTVQRLEPLPQADSAVTAYQVTVEIDPAGSALKPGMTASATIVADSRSNVLSVPAAAVRTEGATSLVSVVTTAENGQRSIDERAVKLGLRAGERVEILSGLAEGEQVLVP
ncbi:MAG: efflux RND transporter periplasmic adaptor subunit [Chloroflexi bacterium OHK40]